MKVRTIAALAREGGVGVETVRFYQRRGLMPTPERWSSSGVGAGVRRYGDGDVRRLKFIRSAQTAGFTLEQIRALLSLDAGEDRERARALATERLAAGAGELRDVVVEAWRASADAKVGWRPVAVADVIAGKVDPYPNLYGID